MGQEEAFRIRECCNAPVQGRAAVDVVSVSVSVQNFVVGMQVLEAASGMSVESGTAAQVAVAAAVVAAVVAAAGTVVASGTVVTAAAETVVAAAAETVVTAAVGTKVEVSLVSAEFCHQKAHQGVLTKIRCFGPEGWQQLSR